MTTFEESSFVIVMCGEGVDESHIVTGWPNVLKFLENEQGFTLDELNLDDDRWSRRDQDDEKFECETEFEIGWLRITRLSHNSEKATLAAQRDELVTACQASKGIMERAGCFSQDPGDEQGTQQEWYEWIHDQAIRER